MKDLGSKHARNILHPHQPAVTTRMHAEIDGMEEVTPEDEDAQHRAVTTGILSQGSEAGPRNRDGEEPAVLAGRRLRTSANGIAKHKIMRTM